MLKLSFAENLICPGLHVLPALLSLHEGSLDLALLHPTATQLRPINIFWTFLWLQLHLLNPLHLSFHCVLSGCSDHFARVALLVGVLTLVPFESLTRVVVTRQCLLPLVHGVKPVLLSVFCVLVIWRCISAGSSTFKSVYCCFGTSTTFGTFWLFMTMCCTCVLESSDVHSKLSLWSNVLQSFPVS